MTATAYLVAAIAALAQFALLLVVLRDAQRERERAARELAAAHARADALALAMADRVEGALVASLRTQMFGSPHPPQEDEVARATPSATTRAARDMTEATIRNGMAVLREGYRHAGLTPDDETLRAEVVSMLGGESPPPPRELASLLGEARVS
jgi:hypothetical protein